MREKFGEERAAVEPNEIDDHAVINSVQHFHDFRRPGWAFGRAQYNRAIHMLELAFGIDRAVLIALLPKTLHQPREESGSVIARAGGRQ